MLTRYAQIGAGDSPLATMRENASSLAKSKLRKQMRQLMPERSIDFSRTELLQSGIERNEATSEIGPTHRGPHPSIPFHPQTRPKTFCIECTQKRHGATF
jgi:hypothetical protein